MSLLCLGMALVLGAPWVTLPIPLVVLGLYAFAIRHEEAYLESTG
jgi:protein-S-isoprenylcysteine O-methyltransferase Ste14